MGFGLRPPEHQQLADGLHKRTAQNTAQACTDVGPGLPVITKDPNLDQPVRGQGAIGFDDQVGREPGFGDEYHRRQRMGLGPQGTAFGGTQGRCGGRCRQEVGGQFGPGLCRGNLCGGGHPLIVVARAGSDTNLG